LENTVAGVAGPCHEQPHNRRDVHRVLDVALKLDLVGHDERDEERNGHAADEPGEVTSSADRMARRLRRRCRSSPRVNCWCWGLLLSEPCPPAVVGRDVCIFNATPGQRLAIAFITRPPA
jgi:hypothetical protein